jgi:hypothetical protein
MNVFDLMAQLKEYGFVRLYSGDPLERVIENPGSVLLKIVENVQQAKDEQNRLYRVFSAKNTPIKAAHNFQIDLENGSRIHIIPASVAQPERWYGLDRKKTFYYS